MKIVIIDNYDSFTYNLAHLVKELGVKVEVLRNDQFKLEELYIYDKIILSPGPGIPEEAGLLLDVIRTYAGRKSMLGVCLGEQAIGQAFGGKLTNLSNVFHGVQTPVLLAQNRFYQQENSDCRDSILQESQKGKGPFGDALEPDYIFDGLSSKILVGRYHSWVVDSEGFPDCLAVTATSAEGHIMALKHRTYDIHGIQFHPESVLTPDGKVIMRNWLSGNPNPVVDRW
ncbi:MAG: aminodeoxychorismate/anthranilate synthase component II [Bacteroides sp.]|jgi:anthranilate synthase component 2|nr:aminodeoxychorismate/anthranilate synthase component II [Bacteroides sp.]MCI1683095.1 aminodeoxychorismate/anthranilate synthase component II [Bacteroides sp.]